jgi:hypothetical protein
VPIAVARRGTPVAGTIMVKKVDGGARSERAAQAPKCPTTLATQCTTQRPTLTLRLFESPAVQALPGSAVMDTLSGPS